MLFLRELPVRAVQHSSLPLRCSVVIPSYNRPTVLPRAVASVLAQDEPDFELIIVDDFDRRDAGLDRQH